MILQHFRMALLTALIAATTWNCAYENDLPNDENTEIRQADEPDGELVGQVTRESEATAPTQAGQQPAPDISALALKQEEKKSIEPIHCQGHLTLAPRKTDSDRMVPRLEVEDAHEPLTWQVTKEGTISVTIDGEIYDLALQGRQKQAGQIRIDPTSGCKD